MLSPVLLALSSGAAQAETLAEYAASCDLAVGVSVPDFNCDDGTLIPTNNHVGDVCDQPNRLNGVCDPNSRLLLLDQSDSAYIVASCRKQNNSAGKYGDIAVIQHNTENGATCFYQGLGVLDGEVTAPSRGTSSEGGWSWLTPSGTADIGCAGCHDNGPLMRSPYITAVTGAHQLPGVDDWDFNAAGEPYWFVGEDFYDWITYSVDVGANSCTSCHRMGSNNVPDRQGNVNRGVSRDFGLRATADQETNKTVHTPALVWMPPEDWSGTDVYSSSYEGEAEEFAACVDGTTPSGMTCTITRESGIAGIPYDDGTLVADPTVAGGRWGYSGGRDPDTEQNPWYRLVIAQTSAVQIDLIADVDTYLYLLSEDGETLIEEDDDDGHIGRNAQIARTLGAGIYTVVAGTYHYGEEDDFHLVSNVGELLPVTNGAWSSSGGRSTTSTSNHYYRFLATQTGTAAFSLTSPDTDNYLYLLDETGATVDDDDDDGPGLNAAITHAVSNGEDYIVVAATSYSYESDDYYLTAPHGQLQPALTGSWDGSVAVSGIPGPNVSFDFSISHTAQVEFNLMSSWTNDPYLYLLDSLGTPLEGDDDDGTGRNARILRHLTAGDYTLVASVYNPSAAGTFYLSASRGELTP